MTRLFVSDPIILLQNFILKDDPFNHAIRVLRMNICDEITLFNGLGGEYRCHIIDIQKKQATLSVTDFKDINRNSPLKIHLFQSLAKGDKMDLILQKATELGVNEITLLNTERCIATISTDRIDKKMTHFNAIIISACEQSGCNNIPTLHASIKLAALHLQPNWLYITLNPYATQNLSGLIQTLSSNSEHKISNIALIIGPEGGLSQPEIDLLSQKGCHGISLSTRILRTETAGIAVVGALQALLGDW